MSKTESGDMLEEISAAWKMDVPRTKNLRVYSIADDAQLIVGRGLRALRIGGQYVPFLSETQTLEKFPRVTVDMGAVRFMCKGANVMRPGIREFSEFESGDLVCVAEESHNKFLAVGRSLVSSGDAQSMEKGEVLKNLHFISDRFWDSAKEIND